MRGHQSPLGAWAVVRAKEGISAVPEGMSAVPEGISAIPVAMACIEVPRNDDSSTVPEDGSWVSSPLFGSEQEEYKLAILQALLSKRIVSVLGQTGMSRSSLACTFCHNIGQYAFAVLNIEWIYYVKVKKKKPRSHCRVKELTKSLLEQLVKDVGVPVLEPEAGIGAYVDAILQGVRTMNALIVFDRIEYLTRSESEEFTVLLSRLSAGSEQVRILLTNNRTMGIPSLAEQVVNLGASKAASMVRLMLSYVRRKPLYTSFSGTHPVQIKILGPKVEFDMLRQAVSGNRIVSLVGQTGLSRSAVVCGFCHHIRDHPNIMSGIDWIYYVKAEESLEPGSRLLEMTNTLLRRLVEDFRIPEHEPYVHIAACLDAVSDGMKDMKALVVLDRVEYLTDTDRMNLLVLLSRLREEAPHVKVLVTNTEVLGVSSLREYIVSLGPFNFARTLGLLSLYWCREDPSMNFAGIHPIQACRPLSLPAPRTSWNHEDRVRLFRPLTQLRLAEIPSSIEDAFPGNNSITVLFSAPLAYNDGRQLRPFAKLDVDMERELMWQCLSEASRDIDLFFDNATSDRLLATMAKRCSCLHYSGHGQRNYLPFEDGEGGPDWFKVDQLKDLIAREGTAPFRFVFVSAPYSGLAGHTFASAGVPHVVCCQQESELKDTAALAFTRQFYLALAVGHTVRDSFELGCKAVPATLNLKDPEKEMRKFMLLPEDGNHEVPIFKARRVAEWPKPVNDGLAVRNNPRHRRRSEYSRVSSTPNLGPWKSARTSYLSAYGMMQEDPSPSPPHFFLGREVDMYVVLQAILKKNLVSVVGEVGMGRSSLVCALCHYINERASTILAIDRIYYVKVQSNRKKNRLQKLAKKLLGKLVEEGKAPMLESDADIEEMIDAICRSLKGMKALIVFDHVEYLQDAESNEFPMLLSRLARDTRHVKVLLTNRRTLGIPSLGEHIISLGPLNFASTVRLFSNLCPYLHSSQDRQRLFTNLASDQAEAELFMTDPGLRESTKQLFAKLGEGIPSRVENAAFAIPEDEVMEMLTGRTAF